jgi:hypothetical protein
MSTRARQSVSSAILHKGLGLLECGHCVERVVGQDVHEGAPVGEQCNPADTKAQITWIRNKGRIEQWLDLQLNVVVELGQDDKQADWCSRSPSMRTRKSACIASGLRVGCSGVAHGGCRCRTIVAISACLGTPTPQSATALPCDRVQ